MNRRTFSLAASAALAATFTACVAPEDPAPQVVVQAATTPRSLSPFSVLTYNTQFRPAVVDVHPGNTAGENRDIYGMDDKTRAAVIAAKILAAGADVVALQEVWLREPYEALVDALSATYPHYTRFDDILDEDIFGSGMVLFSRFPMRSLGSVDHFGARNCLRAVGGSCFAQLIEYDAQAQLEERVARKGLGYALLDNPQTSRPMHVFFTHLESSSAERDTRRKQLEQVLPFIVDRLAQPASMDAVMLGDLNIIAPRAGDAAEEYQEHVAGLLGGVGLRDGWSSQSPDDNGFTFDPSRSTAASSGPRQRLDYVLVRSAAEGPRLCLQHSVVERERFVADEVVDGFQVKRDLSDHFAVSARFAQEGAQCDPARAELLALDATRPEVTLTRQLAHRGSAQWYRIDQPGTYSLRAARVGGQAGSLRVTAYRADELSSPMPLIEGEELLTGRERSVVLADAPFYVRVESPEAEPAGAYTFQVRLHQGASFADAIALAPEAPFAAVQMTSAVSQPLAKVHFRLRQRALHSGAPQRLTFSLSAPVPLRLTVLDAQRQSLPGLVMVASQASLEVPAETSPISGAEQELFLTVDRLDCTTCQEAPFSVSWRSELRQLALGKLTVLHQTDGPFQPGYDEVSVFMSVDGGPEELVLEAELDRHAASHLAVPAQLAFRDAVKLRIVEHDPVNDDEFAVVALTATSAEGVADFFAAGGFGHYTLGYRVTP